MLQTPPSSTARILPSPERLAVQMRYVERRYDDVLGKVLEQNALILKSVSRMQDDLKNLRTKLESLELSSAQDEVITASKQTNGVTDNSVQQGQNGVGGSIHSPANLVGSSLSSLASPFQQQQSGPYYNPYPHPIYNPYMMMPMSDPMGYFVNPTMQYAAMYAALGQNSTATTPVAPPPTELSKATPPPFSFGVSLPTTTEDSPLPAMTSKPAAPTSTTSIFSHLPKTSPAVSNLKPPLIEKAVIEPKKEDKTATEPDFAALSSKMCGFGDLSKSTSTTTSTTTTNPFGSFVFGSGSVQPVFSSPSKTSSTLNTSTAKSPANANPAHADDDEVTDDFVPTAQFAPVIPLPPLVEVKKGDENENVLFQHRAKLLRFVKEAKEWKERGVGDIKILQSKEVASKIRVVMWREKVHKIACNHWVTKDLEVTNYQDHPKNLMWTALDFAEADDGPKTEIFVCRFGQEEQANEFKKQIGLAVSIVNQSPTTTPEKSTTTTTTKSVEPVKEEEKQPVKTLSELFKKPEGQWNCAACYTHNDKDSVACVACNTAKPGCTLPTPKEAPKVTAPTFSFGFKLPSAEESVVKPTNIFSQPPQNSPKPLLEKVAEPKKDEKTAAEPDFAALSSKMCGFGDLSKSTSTTISNTTTTKPFGSFVFGSGAVQPVFSSPSTTSSILNNSTNKNLATSNATHGDEEVVDEFVPTAEFAPVIPLPPLVEVKKGDENESVLFQHRAKLLRFVKEAKEWKERGVGDIKILQSKEVASKIRVVMWREKVHKIACNHWVTKDLEVTNYQDHPKNLMWTALDFAEADDGPKTEIFVCRFGHEEQANEFKKQIGVAVSIVSQAPASPEKAAAKVIEKPKEEVVKPLSFSGLFKKQDGQWDCSACYTSNNKDSVTCVACNTAKQGGTTLPVSKETENTGPHDPPCRGCDPDTFDFSALDGRQVPTFEDLPKPQRPVDSTTKNETLKDLLTKNTTINNKTVIPQATENMIAGSGDAKVSSVSSALSSFSFSLPSFSTTVPPSTTTTTTTTGEPFKMNVPTFSFNPNFTFSKENMSSITTTNSIFGGAFSAIDSTVPSTVDGLNNDENGDEDYEDDEDETMFLSDGHVYCRKGSGDFEDMGDGQVKIVYDGEHYCARFNFLSETDEIEHFVATETTVTSTGDNTFEWDFINLTGNENADKSRIRVVFPDQQAFDSFASTMSDSVDMAMQAGVTEADLRDEAAQHD